MLTAANKERSDDGGGGSGGGDGVRGGVVRGGGGGGVGSGGAGLEELEGGVFATAARLGPTGLFVGTQARLAQMLLIVVVQLLANDSIRSAVGLGTM